MKRIRRRQQGVALISVFIILTVVAVGTTAYVSSATQTIRLARQTETDTRLSHTSEAGVQRILVTLWRPFRSIQKFDTLDDTLEGASIESPKGTVTGVTINNETFSAAVVGYSEVDSYNRRLSIRSVSWVDKNTNGSLDTDETRKIVDVVTVFSLGRSQVFDYTYFVNNYGWMTGFGKNDLIVNGDMRANGNFDFSGGTPTINGSVYASANDKLVPAAQGIVNITPNQTDNSTYNSANNPVRRQAYDAARHGAKGSEEYEKWRDFIYDKDGQIVNGGISGSVIGSSSGFKTYPGNLLDSTPTSEVIMPDLSDITRYTSLSNSYVDTRPTFDNGVANPNYNLGAFVKVWNQSLNGGAGAYQTISTNGVVTGSAALIGTSAHPIQIHGPVTFTQDCAIKGYVQGQGTVYTGRNVHVVGSIMYKNPPDFSGTNQQQIDNNNSAKDMLALAARGSIIMGNVKNFAFPYPLQYMTPPFTKGRYDDNGNWIPPFDGLQVDSTGFKRYQCVLGDNYINSIAEPIGEMNCILYTNFLGGGQLGNGTGGVDFNGSIISKDEAMVIYSLPMIMNYDHRIRERKLTKKPLIDLDLPRTPSLIKSTYQDRGLIMPYGTVVGGN